MMSARKYHRRTIFRAILTDAITLLILFACGCIAALLTKGAPF